MVHHVCSDAVVDFVVVATDTDSLCGRTEFVWNGGFFCAFFLEVGKGADAVGLSACGDLVELVG